MKCACRVLRFLFLLMLVAPGAAQPGDSTFAVQSMLDGDLSQRNAQFTKAEKHYLQAASSFRASGYIEQSLTADLSRAEMYMRYDQSELSERVLDSVLQILLEKVEITEPGRLRLRAYSIRFENTDSDSVALQCLQQMDSIMSNNVSWKPQYGAMVGHAWGLYFLAQEMIDSCDQRLAEALPLAIALDHDYLVARIALLWAKALRRQGDHAKAADLIREGIMRYTNYYGRTNATDIATGYNDLAIVQKTLGDLEGSGQSFRKALEIRRNLYGKRSNGYARVLNNATLQLLDEGDLGTALQYAKETIDIFNSLQEPDRRFYLASYNTLAQIYTARGELLLAEKAYRRAIEMHETYYPGNPRIRYYLISLGNNAMRQEEYQSAIVHFHRAMSATLDGIDANDIYSKPSRDHLANLQSLRTLCLHKARAFLAWYKVSQDSSHLQEAINLFALSDHFAAKNRTESQYQKSRMAYSRQNLTLYQGAIEASLAMFRHTHDTAHLEQAYLYSEKSKSLTLLENLLEASALHSSGLPVSMLEKEKLLQDSLQQINRAFANARSKKDSGAVSSIQQLKLNLELQYDQFKQELENNYPKFYQSKYDFNFTTLKDVQDWLADSTQLISFFVGRDKIFRFFVRDSHIVADELIKPDSLNYWVTNLRESLRSYDPSKPTDHTTNRRPIQYYCSTARKLYISLVGDLQHSLGARLIIVPHDVLNYLPFGILLEKDIGPGELFSEYSFMEMNHSISYNYSSTLARQMSFGKAVKSDKILGVAPEFKSEMEGPGSRDQLTPLLHNREEVTKITTNWKGKLLLGSQATQADFLENMQEFGIIHFATHALVNEGDADLSYLAFAGPDPYLYLQELYNLELPVKMVTLSACETNMGPLSQGEGIASLAKGFSYAGAKSIITSLWEVEDAAAQEIMTDFYVNLSKGLTKDVALSAAKRKYIRNAANTFAHPFYWATYVPIGDMSIIQHNSFGSQTLFTIGAILIMLLLVMRFFIQSAR